MNRKPATATGAKTKSSEVKRKAQNGATLGFEEKLWTAADKLRNNVDPAEYKHVVLGLIFLKYISDAFEERRAWLEAETRKLNSEYFCKKEEQRTALLEDRDEYHGANVFWVPSAARWAKLQAAAMQPTIGKLVDDAMAAIEKDNPNLKGVLPKEYARPTLDKHTLGELINLIGTIGLGDKESRSTDVLGRVYEYFIGKFASAEGKRGGDYFTPRCVVKLLVEMIEPYRGRVLDPCCGSGGMFIQSERFVQHHGGRIGDLSIFGQEINPTTWRLCKMNLAIRGIEGNLGLSHADSLRSDLHPDLKADFILANPPFNVSDWKGELLREDARWRFGVPPVGNANFAWVQHFIHHLAPNGVAGFVLANGSMDSNQSGEGQIRKSIVQADLVDCMIALPDKLFYTVQIPACLWFLARNKADKRFRDRRGEILLIDARKLGALVDRTHREFSDDDIARITKTYHAWRGEKDAGKYQDVAGFCKSASLKDIEAHGFVLRPGRHVGAVEAEDDDEPFEERIGRLVAQLQKHSAEGARLDAVIAANLTRLGYGS